MNYCGVTLDGTLGEEAMDKALRPVLMKVEDDKSIITVRGLSRFENNGYVYTFKTTGTIKKLMELSKYIKTII